MEYRRLLPLTQVGVLVQTVPDALGLLRHAWRPQLGRDVWAGFFVLQSLSASKFASLTPPPSLSFFLLLPFLCYLSTDFDSVDECEPSTSQITFPFHGTGSCYLQWVWWVCNPLYMRCADGTVRLYS